MAGCLAGSSRPAGGLSCPSYALRLPRAAAVAPTDVAAPTFGAAPTASTAPTAAVIPTTILLPRLRLHSNGCCFNPTAAVASAAAVAFTTAAAQAFAVAPAAAVTLLSSPVLAFSVAPTTAISTVVFTKSRPNGAMNCKTCSCFSLFPAKTPILPKNTCTICSCWPKKRAFYQKRLHKMQLMMVIKR